MSNLLQVCVLIAIPVVATVIGALAAIRRRPGPKLISGVQHFAAGVVLAAVAGEVLPSLKEEGHLGWAALGFLAGIGLVIVLEMVSEREKAHEEKVRKGLIPNGCEGRPPPRREIWCCSSRDLVPLGARSRDAARADYPWRSSTGPLAEQYRTARRAVQDLSPSST